MSTRPVIFQDGELAQLPIGTPLAGVPIDNPRDPLAPSNATMQRVWDDFARLDIKQQYLKADSADFAPQEFHYQGWKFECRPLAAYGGSLYWIRIFIGYGSSSIPTAGGDGSGIQSTPLRYPASGEAVGSETGFTLDADYTYVLLFSSADAGSMQEGEGFTRNGLEIVFDKPMEAGQHYYGFGGVKGKEDAANEGGMNNPTITVIDGGTPVFKGPRTRNPYI